MYFYKCSRCFFSHIEYSFFLLQIVFMTHRCLSKDDQILIATLAYKRSGSTKWNTPFYQEIEAGRLYLGRILHHATTNSFYKGTLKYPFKIRLKTFFIKEKQIARHFVHYGECLYRPPFLLRKSLYLLNVPLVQNLF